jgi:hypothetical protein
MAISILPPDVNESDLYFTPVGDSIRFGLAAIKNVGENTAKAIRESRLNAGEFKSLYESGADPLVVIQDLLETTHFHAFIMGIIYLTLAHLFIATESSRARPRRKVADGVRADRGLARRRACCE